MHFLGTFSFSFLLFFFPFFSFFFFLLLIHIYLNIDGFFGLLGSEAVLCVICLDWSTSLVIGGVAESGEVWSADKEIQNTFQKPPPNPKPQEGRKKKKSTQREREICQSIGHICLFYFTYNNPSFPFLPPFFFFFSFQFLFNKNSIDPLIIYYFAFTNQIIHFIHSFFFFLDWIFALYVRYLTHLPRHCRRRRIL